jgi:hypothetical protein
MKIFSLLSGVLVLAVLFVSACKEDPEDPDNPNPIKTSEVTEVKNLVSNTPSTISGDIADGEIMDDLTWAANSSVACFPGTRAIEFMGNQLFYQVDIPQGQELKITVTPTGEKSRINLYGYINFDGSNTPPISSCISCEAGYEIYAGNPDLTKPGEPQSISFSQAVNKGFTVFVCVSGAKDVTTGTFDLSFELSPM